MRALVIGGTGPTGHFIVNGLRERGYGVTILHRGEHEIPEIPDDVEHLHADPYSEAALREIFAERTYDVCVATYGRLRATAAITVGKVGRFVSVGGAPAYRGYMHPGLYEPPGLPVPLPENAPLVEREEEDAKGYRIMRTEQAVFAAHPTASHFRYPYVYGPYQLLPREWCIVRRIRDGRRHIVLADGGLTLHHFGYAGNVAHAVLLAVDRPEASAGQIYHCADEEVLTVRQVVEIVGSALGAQLEIVSLPWELAIPARPLVMQPLNSHRVFDLTKLKQDLGYRDVVPAREALATTARWLMAHPPEPGGTEEVALTDPFDYAAEDRLIEAWQNAVAEFPEIRFDPERGLTLSYSGPGGRSPSQPEFD